MSTVAWVLLHFALGVGGTWLARRYAVDRQLLDQPGKRRSHAVATPRGGGISIVLALVAALLLVAPAEGSLRLLLVTALAGLVLVAAAGWADDHRPVAISLRFAMHLVASALLAAGVQQATGHNAATAVVFVLGVVLVNVWNFMDGIDGLAATQAALVGLACALFFGSPLPWALALALIGAIAGFVPFNFPAARIFLGDVGSGALGFAIALLIGVGIAADRVAPGLELAALALPLSAFTVDASLTLARRILRGEQWWTAHVGHAYQRCVARGHRHWVVTTAYAVWTLGGVGLMLGVQHRSLLLIMAVTTAWHLLAAIAWFGLQDRTRTEPQGCLK